MLILLKPIIVKQLLSIIVANLMNSKNPLLTTPVEIEALFTTTLAGDVHEKKWENFAEEIKFKNRFFLKETVDLKLLAILLKYFSRSYHKGKIFYRVRISDQTGFSIDQMGKPPADKATSGRANPKGIPYLYLATRADTAIYESRSTYLDYVTIAEFKLIDTLQVVSLREITSLSPFIFGDQITNYISHQKYLSRLEKELSKPIRKNDKELDYLPSQYLCEYVKSLGYDAIEYGSAQKKNGINIAVFTEDKLEPSTADVYEISGMNLNYVKL